jgi:hypothetical protein
MRMAKYVLARIRLDASAARENACSEASISEILCSTIRAWRRTIVAASASVNGGRSARAAENVERVVDTTAAICLNEQLLATRSETYVKADRRFLECMYPTIVDELALASICSQSSSDSSSELTPVDSIALGDRRGFDECKE